MEKIDMLKNVLYNEEKTVEQWRKLNSSINCAGIIGYPYGKKN